MRTGLACVCLLHVGGGVTLAAQQRAAPFLRWEASAPTPEPSTSWRAPQEKSTAAGDYRYEGLALGAVGFGALGAWVGSQISPACPLEPGGPCYTDRVENAVALGLVGAAVGGGLGYLVGLLSPKRPSLAGTEPPALDLVTVPDSVRMRTGYQHWRGAAIGLAIGGAVGALTGAVGGAIGECDDCSRQPSAGNGALTVGLIGAGAGGVLGFLAGLSSPKYAWVPSGAH